MLAICYTLLPVQPFVTLVSSIRLRRWIDDTEPLRIRKSPSPTTVCKDDAQGLGS